MSYVETIPRWIIQAAKQCLSEGAQIRRHSDGRTIHYVFGPYEVVQTMGTSVITWRCPCPTNRRYTCHHILAAQQLYGRLSGAPTHQHESPSPSLTQIASECISLLRQDEAIRILRDYVHEDTDFALYLILRMFDQWVDNGPLTVPAQILDAILLPCYRGAQPSQKLLHRFDEAAKLYLRSTQRALDQSNLVQAAELLLSLCGRLQYLLAKTGSNNARIFKRLDTLYRYFENLAMRVEARPLIASMNQRIEELLSKSYYRFVCFPDPLVLFALDHFERADLKRLYAKIMRFTRRTTTISAAKTDHYLLSALHAQLIAHRVGKSMDEVFRAFYTEKKLLLWALDWLKDETNAPMRIALCYWGAIHFHSIALAEYYLQELSKTHQLSTHQVQKIIQLLIRLQSPTLIDHPLIAGRVDILKALEVELQARSKVNSSFFHQVHQRVRLREGSSIGGEK